MPTLPIHAALPELLAALREHPRVVLEAPPGAGKTTVVPLALLDEPWLGGGRVLLLEPRRLAARAAARYMARSRGEEPGGTVGYRVRLERRVGPRTRVEVVTEGILTRLLVDDPALDGVGGVLFDEFHERSIHADLGLALALESQAALRPDLRLVVMSATLDGARVAALLGGAPVIRAEGRQHPVTTRYQAARDDRALEARVASAVREALASEPGDVLCFLPGQAEIHRTADLLGDSLGPAVDVHALYGDLSAEAQDAAVAPAPAGRRKVVLATSIAESSLTIEGVRLVVDGGLARVPRHSVARGMTRLETVRVSRASADQRRGRAGRTAPGACWRLWPEGETAALLPYAPPEILEADLAPMLLDLAAAGVAEPGSLRWLDPPPAGAVAQARELLRDLEAVDAKGRITDHGRRLATLGLHPRLGHMLVAADAAGQGALACDLAALLDERDVLRDPEGHAGVDVRLRLDLLAGRRAALPPGVEVRHGALARVRQLARGYRERLGVRAPERGALAAGRRAADAAAAQLDRAGEVAALAYPDRVGQHRGGRAPRYVLRNGAGVVLAEGDPLAGSAWLVVLDLDGRRPESRVFLAAPLERAAVDRLFGGQVTVADVVEIGAGGALAARRVERLGAIVLAERPVAPAPDALRAAFTDLVRREGLGALPWSDGARRLRERLAFLHRHHPGWPDVSDEALLAELDAWLGPRLSAAMHPRDLQRLDVAAALLDRLPWAERAALDTLAPSHVTVPTGSRLPIDYADPEAPVLAVRIQEVFGLREHPAVLRGAVPLVLHLLSPAQRPVQVTRDLPGFWRSSYHDVRKDLRGRYPRHPWPDDPAAATPTRRATPRVR